MKQIRKKNKGMLLITTLLISTLILIFFAAIISSTFTENRQLKIAIEREKALLGARAAYQEALYELSITARERLLLVAEQAKWAKENPGASTNPDILKPITGIKEWKPIKNQTQDERDFFPIEYGYIYKSEYPYQAGNIIAGGRIKKNDNSYVTKYVSVGQITICQGVIASTLYTDYKRGKRKSSIFSIYSEETGHSLRPWIGLSAFQGIGTGAFQNVGTGAFQDIDTDESESPKKSKNKEEPDRPLTTAQAIYDNIDCQKAAIQIINPLLYIKPLYYTYPETRLYNFYGAKEFLKYIGASNYPRPGLPNGWNVYSAIIPTGLSKINDPQSIPQPLPKNSLQFTPASIIDENSAAIMNVPYEFFKYAYPITELVYKHERNSKLNNSTGTILYGNNLWINPCGKKNAITYGTKKHPDLVLAPATTLIVTGDLTVTGNIRSLKSDTLQAATLMVFGDLDFTPNSSAFDAGKLLIYASGKIKCGSKWEESESEPSNKNTLLNMPYYLPARLKEFIDNTPPEALPLPIDGYPEDFEQFKSIVQAYRKYYTGDYIHNDLQEKYWDADLEDWYSNS